MPFVFVLSFPDTTTLSVQIDGDQVDSPLDNPNGNNQNRYPMQPLMAPLQHQGNTRLLVTKSFDTIADAETYKNTPPCNAMFNPPTTYVLYEITAP